MMHNAIALLRGDATTALTTIPEQARMNSMVVNGWPGTQKVTVSEPMLRRRKMKRAAAVIPKKIKSTVTSKFKISPYVPEQAMTIAASPCKTIAITGVPESPNTLPTLLKNRPSRAIA